MAVLLQIRTSPWARARDLVALGKPRLSFLVIFTCAVGAWLSPAPLHALTLVPFLLSTALLVGAANTLNCWIEVEIDGLMFRTRGRPLPAGRLVPRSALLSGLLFSAVSLISISLLTNPLTTALGALALTSYVLVYTPLKRVTPYALFVGAVPGALPPLMGWTAATGTLATPGLYVFAILFCWQVPHFIAISLYLKEDFARGGIRVMSLALGDVSSRRHLFAWSVVMAVVSLLALPRGLAGPAYGVVAAILGALLVGLAAGGLKSSADDRWARRFFGFTLIYLPLLVAALVLDARIA